MTQALETTNGKAVAPPIEQSISAVEQALYMNDLSKLNAEQRVQLVNAICHSTGLNPLTKPFEYVNLQGKLTLYATRACTDQLRQIHGVSITGIRREQVGDLYFVTAHAQDKQGRIDESTGVLNVKGLGGEALANALMKAECVPLDSEILTRDGFKRHDEVRIGEEVLAYDVEADETRWTPLLDVTTYGNAPVVRMASDGGQFDVVCTPDHSWAVRSQPYKLRSKGIRKPRGPYSNRGSARKLVKAHDLKTSHGIILAAPEVDTQDSILTPAEASILGWAVTDGTIKRVGNSVRLGVCQSKDANFEMIREAVGAVAGDGVREFVSAPRTRTFPTGRTYDTLPQHWWYIPAAISRAILDRAGFHDREDLPRIVTRLSPPARQAMLQAFMLAEGDDRQNFYNGDPHISDAFNILAALEGLSTGKNNPHLGDVTRQRLKKTRHVAVSFLNTTDAGTADVWCPTTQYGTWVMRQNGRVMITGNTKAKRRVTLSICGLGMLDESEVADAQHEPRVSEWREPEAVTPEIAAPIEADEDGVIIDAEPQSDHMPADPWDELQERMRKAKLSKSFIEGVMYPHPFSAAGLEAYLAEAKRPVADLVEDAIGRRG